jgi:hypothetical protein
MADIGRGWEGGHGVEVRVRSWSLCDVVLVSEKVAPHAPKQMRCVDAAAGVSVGGKAGRCWEVAFNGPGMGRDGSAERAGSRGSTHRGLSCKRPFGEVMCHVPRRDFTRRGPCRRQIICKVVRMR